MRTVEQIEADLEFARAQLAAREDSKFRTEEVARLEAELAELGE